MIFESHWAAFKNLFSRYQKAAPIPNFRTWRSCILHSGHVDEADSEVQGAGGQAGGVWHHYWAVDSWQWSTYFKTNKNDSKCYGGRKQSTSE